MARVVIPGCPHHITQRGNRRQRVFRSDSDRKRYLELLGEYSVARGLSIVAYCLMDNHVHLIAIPATTDALAGALRPVNLRYAQELNRRLGSGGFVWGGRFYSCPLDRKHFWAAVRYVERNPVRAKIVRKAERYPWSSAAAHCGLGDDPLLSGRLEKSDHVGDWSAWLTDAGDEQFVERLRLCTRTGRPAGAASFIRRLERRLGRRLRALPVGRPKRTPPRAEK